MGWRTRLTDLVDGASLASSQAERNGTGLLALSRSEPDPTARRVVEAEGRNWLEIASTLREMNQ